MIEFRNVSFSYSSAPLIRNMNLILSRGVITGLVGPNGSGKSTVMRLAAGIVPAQEGDVLLDGKDIRAIKPKNRAKQIALLHQGVRVPHLLAEDVVLSARYPHRGPVGYSAKDREIVYRSMKQTGCDKWREKQMDQLSGGERQKVFMAAALAQETEILLLDEPTTYLDITSTLSWMQFMCEQNREFDKTIIVVLHDLNLALRFCDRLIIVNDGTLAAQGAPVELLENGVLTDIFQINIKMFHQEGQQYYCYDRALKRYVTN